MNQDDVAISDLTNDIDRRLCIKNRELYAAVPEAPETELLIGCINVGSLKAAGRNREENIATVIEQCNFDIFILQETWLFKKDKKKLQKGKTASDLAPKVPDGFHWARNERKFTKKKRKSDNENLEPNKNVGGGQLIFVRPGIEWEFMSEGEFGNTNVQYLHIEITQPTQLHLIAVYNPPRHNNYKLAYTLMSWYIAALPAGDRVMFIGDVNINWFKRTQFQYAFSEALEACKIRQLIRSATHKTKSGGTCLDHIYTNAQIQESGVVNGVICENGGHPIQVTGISKDHCLIFCTITHNGRYNRASVQEGLSVSEREKTISEKEKFMFCKLEQRFDNAHNLDVTEVDGGFLVLLSYPTQVDEANWKKRIKKQNLRWADVYYATPDMVGQLHQRLPNKDFTLYPN